MLSLDNSLFYLINKNCSNSFLDILAPLFAKISNFQFLFVVGFVLVFFNKVKLKKLGISLMVGLGISYGLVYLLKTWIARPRPFLVLPDVNLLIKTGGPSFPSGHAVFIFLAVTLAAVYYPKCRYLYILAFLAVFFRIYAGVHYPSDVLAGAALGSIIGYGLGKIGVK